MKDVTADEKIGDISSNLADDDPMSSTSFGHKFTETLVLTECNDDAPVNKGAEAPKPRLSPVQRRRMLIPAGGLLFPPFNLCIR